jgi:hypothetical protein
MRFRLGARANDPSGERGGRSHGRLDRGHEVADHGKNMTAAPILGVRIPQTLNIPFVFPCRG